MIKLQLKTRYALLVILFCLGRLSAQDTVKLELDYDAYSTYTTHYTSETKMNLELDGSDDFIWYMKNELGFTEAQSQSNTQVDYLLHTQNKRRKRTPFVVSDVQITNKEQFGLVENRYDVQKPEILMEGYFDHSNAFHTTKSTTLKGEVIDEDSHYAQELSGIIAFLQNLQGTFHLDSGVQFSELQTEVFGELPVVYQLLSTIRLTEIKEQLAFFVVNYNVVDLNTDTEKQRVIQGKGEGFFMYDLSKRQILQFRSDFSAKLEDYKSKAEILRYSWTSKLGINVQVQHNAH